MASNPNSNSAAPPRPNPLQHGLAGNCTSYQAPESSRTTDKARKKRRKKKRKQSFVALDAPQAMASRQDIQGQRRSFYRAGAGRNLSDESLESEALLDHRDQAPMRTRRDSRVTFGEMTSSHRPSAYANPFVSNDGPSGRRQKSLRSETDEDATPTDDRTPLLEPSSGRAGPSNLGADYGTRAISSSNGTPRYNGRSGSPGSSRSGRRRNRTPALRHNSSSMHPLPLQDFDINNPPSVPPSPRFGPQEGPPDPLAEDAFQGPSLERQPTGSRGGLNDHGDFLIDVDGDAEPAWQRMSPSIATRMPTAAEGDVCFPVEGMSEIGEEDFLSTHGGPRGPQEEGVGRRKRGRRWPDLGVLEEWSREERAERRSEVRAKKMTEPVLVGGRLRPQKHGWHREEADAPYRFTYFNEEFENTIHSQTISELLQPGQDFRELFIPDPPELSDESDDEEEDLMSQGVAGPPSAVPSATASAAESKVDVNGSRGTNRESNSLSDGRGIDTNHTSPRVQSVTHSPPNEKAPMGPKPKRYGPRPTFWLDVLSPTEAEMRVIQRTFGIHPLTAEDIRCQEAREKVELFRNYYFVNYRTFEQDTSSDDYLEPVNMYVVVFREGVISFHFSMTPHANNVRRRIRSLKDYLQLTADWISYAIIDDITDVFAPLITSIEKEVDEIDDAILQMHTRDADEGGGGSGGGGSGGRRRSCDSVKDGGSGGGEYDDDDEKHSVANEAAPESGGDMLRRVGEGRKRVMGLYRLLGSKADVIKGFAKRCNQQWDVAPRSEIGLYLGDIQDHILTMTSNLGHYETLLSRAHSNYLAQINIRMNERQEKTADVLGKLTVLGTIVLPMNIITGMWGMNVQVPGQEIENLYWFWSITAGLLVFGVSCFFIAKRVYGIV